MSWVKLKTEDGRNYQILVRWWHPSLWWEIFTWCRAHNTGVLFSAYIACCVVIDMALK